MLKRMCLALAVFGMLTGTISAQSEEWAKNNITLSLGIIGPGAGLSYERMFARHISILADVSFTSLFIVNEFTASIKGRWYPFGNAFYLDLGLGYSCGNSFIGLIILPFIKNGISKWSGFLVQPGLGWKIDIGKPDNFVLPISIGININLGANPIGLPFFRIGLGNSF